MMDNAFCTKNVVLAIDLVKQQRLTQFYHGMMQNAFGTQNVVLVWIKRNSND